MPNPDLNIRIMASDRKKGQMYPVTSVGTTKKVKDSSIYYKKVKDS